MNFSPEMLYMGGLILVIVFLVQYLMFIYLKKQIKNTKIMNKQINKPINKPINKQINSQQVAHNVVIEKPTDSDESYDIDTSDVDADADSYVNPIHSEKHIDETVDDETVDNGNNNKVREK